MDKEEFKLVLSYGFLGYRSQYHDTMTRGDLLLLQEYTDFLINNAINIKEMYNDR